MAYRATDIGEKLHDPDSPEWREARRFILALLKRNRGNASACARVLGVNLRTFQRWEDRARVPRSARAKRAPPTSVQIAALPRAARPARWDPKRQVLTRRPRKPRAA